jgi:fatty-acid desaturase
VNLPIFAWLSYGEGWHRNHHSAPHLARFSSHDVGFWFALVLSKLGLMDVGSRNHPSSQFSTKELSDASERTLSPIPG